MGLFQNGTTDYSEYLVYYYLNSNTETAKAEPTNSGQMIITIDTPGEYQLLFPFWYSLMQVDMNYCYLRIIITRLIPGKSLLKSRRPMSAMVIILFFYSSPYFDSGGITCPNNCSASLGQGTCVDNLKCECEPGFFWVDCSRGIAHSILFDLIINCK